MQMRIILAKDESPCLLPDVISEIFSALETKATVAPRLRDRYRSDLWPKCRRQTSATVRQPSDYVLFHHVPRDAQALGNFQMG